MTDIPYHLKLSYCLLQRYIQYVAKILSLKGPTFPKNWWNWKFLIICTSTHYVFNTYKVLLNSMQRLRRRRSYKVFITLFNRCPKLLVKMGRNYETLFITTSLNNRTDRLVEGLTDGPVKDFLPYATSLRRITEWSRCLSSDVVHHSQQIHYILHIKANLPRFSCNFIKTSVTCLPTCICINGLIWNWGPHE